MSLATTCPACGTAFRVTPEQLSAHRGDVRCGQCQHVFNALNQLVEVPLAPQPIPVSQPIQPEENPAADFAATVVLPKAPATEPAAVEEIQPPPEPASLPPEAEPDTVVEMTAPMHEASALDTENLDFELEPPAEEVIEIASSWPEDEAYSAETTAAPAPAITLQPSAQVTELLADKPKRGVSTWLLALFALLLLLGAVGQAVYFMRTEIASNFHPAKPWLDRGCLWLGCTVELPRHVDMFVIEDSDLKDDADHDGVIVLTYVLFNRAPYAQAYPLLELTLTDTFDKPVLRHTFTPQEYLPKGTDISAGIGASSETSSRLRLTVSGDKPAGYRLWVKY